MSNAKHHNLSILLLKSDFDPIDQAIKEDSRTKKVNIKKGSQEIGILFLRTSAPNPPKWSSFFETLIDVEDIGLNASVACVLLVKNEDGIFAVTFGQGRYLLQPDIWVERFGLKVALNSIGKDKIRTIDKKTFDAIFRHSKEQASKETDARDFGLDVEQDLLRAVTGVPKNARIGKKIYGMDSLSVSTDIKIEKIGDYLHAIYTMYTDDAYKTDFPWVDHISEVRDETAVDELDTLLTSQISGGNFDKIWMAVPEFIQWDEVGGFCYGMREKSPEFQDVHLPDFLKSLSKSGRDNISRETFTKKYVHCIHSEGFVMHRWQAYKCLYCEVLKGGQAYLLSGGKWYNVARDFVLTVNQAYDEIPNYEMELPKYDDDSEGEYNERVSREMTGRFALMHNKNIPFGGAPSQIEFCDLFSKDRDIIHIKRYGNASALSHLFAQGRSSGELFQMEMEFRRKVAAMLPEDFSFEDAQERPRSEHYQVVFAIISDVQGDLELSFFSKLNLKNTARNLRGLGYRVAKSKIDVDDGRSKFTKYRRRRKQE